MIGLADNTALHLAGAVLLGGALGAIAMRSVRRKPKPRADEQPTRRGENVLTFVAAALATGVAATGMWQFFSDVLKFPIALLVALFAFLEVAMFASALRARRNVLEFGKAGVDGTAVWALTGLSAVLSATDSHSTKEAAFRLAAPLVAAWLWERGMAIERRRQKTSTIHWRISPERILVRLGLAEAADRTAADVDAHRRITRLARAAKRLRTLQMTGARGWRIRRAIGRVDREMERAVEHADLAADPARRQALMDQISALYNAASLATLTPSAPWTAAIPHRPSEMEAAVRDLADAGMLALTDRTLRALGLSPTSIEQRRADGPSTLPPTSTADAPAAVRPASADGAPSILPTPPETAGNPPQTVEGRSLTKSPASRRRLARRRPAVPKPTAPVDARRSVDDWAELADDLYWRLRERLGRRPKAPEFADAIADAGHGRLSDARIREIRLAIEGRRNLLADEAPALPADGPADAPADVDGTALDGAVEEARGATEAHLAPPSADVPEPLRDDAAPAAIDDSASVVDGRTAVVARP